MADGSRPAPAATTKIEWSSDPAVLRMQMFAFGYGPKDRPAIVDKMFIQPPWFRETKSSIDRALRMAHNARKENCSRGQGPSRAGKTSVCRALIRQHMPWRDDVGLHIPWGYLRIPAVPSLAIVGQETLRALGDPSWEQKRSPISRLARIGEVVEMVGAETLLVDDLHHLVDSRGTRVQHAVADLFIDIGDETGMPFAFFGLSRMRTVFDVNEQLRGRAGSPTEYLRLDWLIKKHRALFLDALDKLLGQFRLTLSIDKSMDDPTVPFRLYCGSGGLLGYLILIFRVAEDECRKKKVPLGIEVLRRSVLAVVGKAKSWPGGRDPFHKDFVAEPTKESLEVAKAVGREKGPRGAKGNGSRK